MAATREGRRGYTLSELVFAMMVVGIVMGVAGRFGRPKEIVCNGPACGVWPRDAIGYANFRMQADFEDASWWDEPFVAVDAVYVRAVGVFVAYFLRSDGETRTLVRRESDASCLGSWSFEEEICRGITRWSVEAVPNGVRVRIATEDCSDAWVVTFPDETAGNWESIGTVN